MKDRYNLYIDVEIKKLIKILAEKDRRTISQYITTLILREYQKLNDKEN